MKRISTLLASSMLVFSLGALAQTPPPASKDGVRADREKMRASGAELQKDREQLKRDEQALRDKRWRDSLHRAYLVLRPDTLTRCPAHQGSDGDPWSSRSATECVEVWLKESWDGDDYELIRVDTHGLWFGDSDGNPALEFAYRLILMPWHYVRQITLHAST